MRQWAPMLLALALAGCEETLPRDDLGQRARIGPPTDPDSVDYASGTRLRARVYVTDSGARKRHGWLDLETGQECAFNTATDGVTRCLPQQDFLTLYADPDCARPAVPAGDERPGMAGLYHSGCFVIAAHELLPPTRVPVLYYSLGASGCAPFAPAGHDVSIRELGPEIAPSRFVAGEFVVEPRGGRLGVQLLRAEDGARQSRIPFDRQLGTSCSPTTVGEHTRCVPVQSAWLPQGAYADPACQNRAASVLQCTPIAIGKLFATLYPEDPCGEPAPLGVVPLLEPLGSPPFEISGGQCRQSESGNGGSYARTGEFIPVDALPLILHSHEATGQVSANWQLSSEGDRLTQRDLFDHATGERCRAERASDCTIRCMPVVGEVPAGWSDPSCTRPAVARFPGLACGAELAPVVIGRMNWAPCKAPVARIYRVGPLISDQQVLYQEGCTGTTAGLQVEYYEAAEIPPSEFPELIDATE